MEPVLKFRQWIEKYVPDFIIDEQASPIVTKLGLWAHRNEAFNDKSVLHHLNKGICLTGEVGTGKTDIMRLFSQFNAYLQSPYRFKSYVVWKFAEDYKEIKSRAFSSVSTGNWYFDELALLNSDGVPYMEMINDFGNRVLIGEQLILQRYNIFKQYGFVTHFSSNCGPKKLKEVYGTRAYSRLTEMVNFIAYTGKDRRQSIQTPRFYSNENNYQPANANVPDVEAVNMESKEMINTKYLEYCHTPDLKIISGYEFEILKSFGILCATDQELNEIRLEMETFRIAEIEQPPVDRDERNRFKQLKKQYENNTLDQEEKNFIWHRVKKIAVQKFFEREKLSGTQKIFEI